MKVSELEAKAKEIMLLKLKEYEVEILMSADSEYYDIEPLISKGFEVKVYTDMTFFKDEADYSYEDIKSLFSIKFDELMAIQLLFDGYLDGDFTYFIPFKKVGRGEFREVSLTELYPSVYQMLKREDGFERKMFYGCSEVPYEGVPDLKVPLDEISDAVKVSNVLNYIFGRVGIEEFANQVFALKNIE